MRAAGDSGFDAAASAAGAGGGDCLRVAAVSRSLREVNWTPSLPTVPLHAVSSGVAQTRTGCRSAMKDVGMGRYAPVSDDGVL